MTEALVRKKDLANMNASVTQLFIVFAFAILGVVLFVLYMSPFQSLAARSLGGILEYVQIKNLLKSIILPGTYFGQALGFKSQLFASFVIWTVFVYLLRKPFIFLIFFLSVVGVGLFHEWFEAPVYLRHQGLLIILLVVVLWLDRLESRVRDCPSLMNNMAKKLSANMNANSLYQAYK